MTACKSSKKYQGRKFPVCKKPTTADPYSDICNVCLEKYFARQTINRILKANGLKP